ncbi:hypothetical protein CK203_111680 [Vitis vinifera]|uniref:SWIM-type domain-containing protein n=1 Tax=Vitis vinifera TaxID=29760 RepID=A0A438BP49_VITVI|nr:hypothetical protein CK203_111680 [Vitis vinifera]
MLMQKSRHIHCDSVETLTVDGENGPRFQNESLEGYKVHDWNMNETAINEEDYRMNTNPTSDKQVTQIGSFRTGSAQSAEILTMIDTNDGFIHDNPIIIEDVANERQNMMQQPIVSGISDDHLEEHQIYSIDGTFLKAKYLGLYLLQCKDGNNQIYPLAFGISDLENDASWEWFLQKLHDALGHIDDLFVISDRHGSIEKAVHKVFPHARHDVCTYHVGQNLKTKFKNPAIHKLFHDAAHAYHVSEFNFIFGQLEMIDPRAARYLMDIELRNLLQKWFVTRQQQAMSMSTELTMWADGELHSRYNMSATYLVEPINSKECNVNYAGISAQVNLDTRSCTCRQFDLDHIPCAHAIAACRFYNISCYTLCSKYFTTKALLSSYSECIYPTGNEIDWVVPNHIRDKVVLPPKTRRPTGRPRK